MGTKKKSQSKKVVPKTRRSENQPKEMKQTSLKQPLSMCLISVSPYDGIPIYTIEKDVLKHVILLNDLRILFKKHLFDIAIFTEQSNPIELERLSIICPEHYKTIFVKERLTLNIELLKNTYPKYYNFISTFNPNIITVEEFKEQYSQILYLLNSNIGHLISMREKINVYNSKEGTFDKRLEDLVNKSIEELESKYTLIKSDQKVVDVQQITSKIKEKEETKVTPNVLVPRIEKFVWLKSQESLEYLFDDLSEEGYIKDYYKELLRQHFTIKKEHIPLINTKGKEEYKRINWNSKNTDLIVLIFQLRLDGSIFFTGDRYHKMAFDHFDKDGNDLNMDSLKTAKSQITNKRSGYIDKPIFQELRNLIKRNKQS